MSQAFKVGDKVIAIAESHGWGDVKKGDVGTVNSIHRKDSDIIFVDFPEQTNWTGELRCFKAWEDIKEKKSMKEKRFNVGDRIRRVSSSHQGSNGTSEQGKEYTVLTADNRCVGIFTEQRGGGKIPEGACWIAANFELVKKAEEVPENWDNVIDLEFGQLNKHKQTLVVKGYHWFCVGCKSASRSKQASLSCCGKDTVNYVDPVDYLWFSSSKDEIVHIQDMLPPHLKAAIVKLRREKERNPMFHLLKALENEAYLRDMDI